jgi:membrane protein
MFQKALAGLEKTRSFVRTGVWRIPSRHLTPRNSLLIRQLRIVLLALRRFQDDRCQLRASALTYYTLFSIVPVLAMAFGVAKGFGFEESLERRLLEAFSDQQETALRVIAFSRTLLEKAQGGLIAGIGVVVLFWTVIKVLRHIETSFNDIWGVKQGRSFQRQVSDYLSIMLVAPILLVLAGSSTVIVASRMGSFLESLHLKAAFQPLMLAVLKVLPYGLIWLLFAFLYVVVPNTRVRIRSGILGGVIAGTLFQIVQWVYIKLQIGVSSYGAVYGSFAALPLFLVWLQTSWLIVLFGAEVAFAEQHVEHYEFEQDCLRVSPRFQHLVALGITRLCVRTFLEGSRPRDAAEIGEALGLPIRLVRDVLHGLTESGVLCQVRRDEEESYAFQPALPPEKLTIAEVIRRLDNSGVDAIPLGEGAEWKALAQRLASMEQSFRQSPGNVPLKDLEA